MLLEIKTYGLRRGVNSTVELNLDDPEIMLINTDYSSRIGI